MTDGQSKKEMKVKELTAGSYLLLSKPCRHPGPAWLSGRNLGKTFLSRARLSLDKEHSTAPPGRVADSGNLSCWRSDHIS